MPLNNAEANRVVQAVFVAATAIFFITHFAMSLPVTGSFDRAIMLFFRDPLDLSDAWGPKWFEDAAADFTALGGYAVLTVFGVIAFTALMLMQRRLEACYLVATVLSGTAISTVIKNLVARPRPDIIPHMDHVVTFSFPSGHSFVGTLAWLTIAAVTMPFIPQKSARVLLLCAGLAMGMLIGLSRIYLGVHGPTDVIAGWSLGIAWAGVCWLVANRLANGTSHVCKSRTS